MAVSNNNGTVVLVPVLLSPLSPDPQTLSTLSDPTTVNGMADSGTFWSFIRLDVAERIGPQPSSSHVPPHFTIGGEVVLSTTGETRIQIRFMLCVAAISVCLIADNLPFYLFIGNDVRTATDRYFSWPTPY